MSELVPTIEHAYTALDLLQQNYTENDHPFSVRGVLPYMRMAHNEPEALVEYVAPMRVSNKATIWLQLKDEPELRQAIHTTFPDEIDNNYFQTLFDHVKNGAELPEKDTWLQKPRPLTTWEELAEEHAKSIAEGEATTVETSLPIGPHGNHRSRNYDIMTAALWMVCRKQSATKRWPIATNPERTPDALHLLAHIEGSSNYNRAAASLSGALAKKDDKETWQYCYDTAQAHFVETYGEQDDVFRALAQHTIRHFAMRDKDYQRVVDSEMEAYPLSTGKELSHFSLAALCAVIERSKAVTA